MTDSLVYLKKNPPMKVGYLGDLNKGRLFVFLWLCFIDIQE